MNQETTLQSLFAKPDLAFHIPPYQRAYSWETEKDRKQVCQFVDDLKEHPQTDGERKSYYYGHFLFETCKTKEGASYVQKTFVIDGQQRLTTAIIFFQCASKELAARKQGGGSLLKSDGCEVDPATLRTRYVIDSNQKRKFHAVPYDDAILKNWILSGTFPPMIKTHSGRRLKEAMEYMTKRLAEEESTKEVVRWVELLENAVISTFDVGSKERATQIFAFQNDRGKNLTNLEKLKAYLMHVVYVHSSRLLEEESIGEMERLFSGIYQVSEEITSLGEDQVLSHHLTAFLPWASDGNPVNVLKKALESTDEGQPRVNTILEFCASLLRSFENAKKIETIQYDSRRHERLIGDVLYLNAHASWPLLLKLFHFHAHELERTADALRLMEITLFKLQFMKGTSTNLLPNRANEYVDGDLQALEVKLGHDSQKGFQWWWDFNGGFRRFLEGPDQYDRRMRYLLWKYENYIRAGVPGTHPFSLRDFLGETESQSLDGSIEHIMPQNPENHIHDEDFKLHYLHNLGNLVLMTRGRNSSLKNKLPEEKAEDDHTPYLSQQVVNKTIKESGWGKAEITERKNKIVTFALNHWKAGEPFNPDNSAV
jgi:hypothetical protein